MACALGAASGTLQAMYLIVIAWGYVTVMMAVAEASSPQGTLLGAAITLLVYGVLPLSILVYILGTPVRKRRLRAQQEMAQRAWEAAHPTPPPTEAAALEAAQPESDLPNARSHAAGTAQHGGIAPVGEKL